MIEKFYARLGINWEFLYQVLYEDDDILVLKDLGRYHRFDTDRSWTKPIDAYIEFYGDYAHGNGWKKLVEVK